MAGILFSSGFHWSSNCAQGFLSVPSCPGGQSSTKYKRYTSKVQIAGIAMPPFLPVKQTRQTASGPDTGEAVLVRIASKIMGDNAMGYTQATTYL